MMGAGMLVAIAIGKCANGFIADHCNIKKIVPLGLLGAAIVNAILGMSNTTWVFIVLWAVNGVFQSMGSAPCIVSLSQWFAKSQLATYYGVFSIAHYVGEGATYLGTSMIHRCPWLACRLLRTGRCLHRSRIHHVPLHARPARDVRPAVR